MGIVFEDYPKGPHTVLALAVIIALFFSYYLTGGNVIIAWMLIIFTLIFAILIFKILLHKYSITK